MPRIYDTVTLEWVDHVAPYMKTLRIAPCCPACGAKRFTRLDTRERCTHRDYRPVACDCGTWYAFAPGRPTTLAPAPRLSVFGRIRRWWRELDFVARWIEAVDRDTRKGP